MMIGLGREASKAFRLEALKFPWIGFSRTRGLKPRMVEIIGAPF